MEAPFAPMSDSPLPKKAKIASPDPRQDEKWDSFHKDPTQDVTIKSTDGVLFRASSYRLSQNSTVLADMFTLPPTSENTIIEMRHASGTIRFFLDCASSSILPKTPHLPLTTAWDLQDMVDFYDSARLRPLAQLALSNAAKASPMEYLSLAAENGDMDMVRQAITYGTESGKAPDAAQFLRILPKMDAETQNFVIEKMAVSKTSGNKIELQWPVASRPNWRSISSSPEPEQAKPMQPKRRLIRVG